MSCTWVQRYIHHRQVEVQCYSCHLISGYNSFKLKEMSVIKDVLPILPDKMSIRLPQKNAVRQQGTR